jgi:hypothetical protein
MQNMLVNSDSILLRPGTKQSFKLRTLEHKHHSTVARFLSSHLIIQYAPATRMEQASCLTL